jgi:uncharacterized membrane protein YhaH (DUF805 family)
MPFPFSFEKPIRRLPYLAWVLGIFFSQHLLALMVSDPGRWKTFATEWEFAVVPLHVLALRSFATWMFVAIFLYQLLVIWSFAALTFRRALEAALPGWIAVFAIVPGLQFPFFLGLSLVPTRVSVSEPPAMSGSSKEEWRHGLSGLLSGIALTVAAVSLSTLVFGQYGQGVFLISPFLVGATTAAIANWHRDMGARYTNNLVASTILLSGMVLMAAAFEGAICLIMAAPIALGMAYVGGLLGREIAVQRAGSPGQTLSSFAVLPLVLAGEVLLMPAISFQTHNTVEIDAPAARVWESIVAMNPIDEPPPMLFRLGMAYPLGGRITGEGVGATRLGAFSTGTTLERVTEWQPGRKITFTVLNDVPAMRELSPYEHVYAPHALGYFTTMDMSFELLPLGDGRTRLIERTSHTLRLEPVLYWLPLARIMLDQNNARVLEHIRRQAEAAVTLRGM